MPNKKPPLKKQTSTKKLSSTKNLASTKTRGKQAEILANKYLKEQGIISIEENFYSRFGEIDLILLQHAKHLLKPTVLIFCEVRSRKNMGFGSALESIDYHKQQKIRKTADYFMLKNPQYANLAARFDVVIVASNPAKDSQAIDWIPNAF